MKTIKIILSAIILPAMFFLTGCFLIDDSSVAKNDYSIQGIAAPLETTRGAAYSPRRRS